MTPGLAAALAVALSSLAGFVDAMGFLMLGGFYVAFMSGNSTILSIGLAAGAESRILLAGGLVGCFVLGVAFGSLLGTRFGAYRVSGVLGMVAALLAAAWALHFERHVEAAGLVMALAMGTENTAFSRQGQTGIGLTYMTGTLVRLGQRLAETLTGGPWRPLVPDLLLWAGMLAGAAAGAVMWRDLGRDGLWAGVAAALAIAVVAAVAIGRDQRRGRDGMARNA